MRELTALEIGQVGGGKSIASYAGDGGAVGTVVGGILTNTLYGAARGGTIGAVAMATYGIAFNVTSWVIDEYIS